MSSEVLSAAVSAIREVTGPAGDAASQAARYQHLEASLHRSEETSGLSAYKFEEAQLKASKAEAVDAHMAMNSSEMQIVPGTPNASLQESLVGYWNGFSERTQNFELGGELAAKGGAHSKAIQPASLQGQSRAQAGANFGLTVHSLQKSFAFAIETSLVSNISHQSTRTLNTLLKGQ
jgi:hypothetical protein